MNLVDADIVDNEARVGDRPLSLPQSLLASATERRITIGFRPEDASIGSEGWPLQVRTVEELGADAFVYGSSPIARSDSMVVVRTDGRVSPRVGQTVLFDVRPERLHAFDSATGLRLDAGA